MPRYFGAQMQRYYTCDALRGVAAILVLLNHGSNVGCGKRMPGDVYLAVDFFFMLSGFVIAFAYQDKLVNNLMSFRDFVFVRFIRLYPMIALGAAIGTARFIVLAYWHGDLHIDTLVASALTFFCIPTMYFSAIFPANGPFWSLFFELWVNFAFAALAPISSRRTVVTGLAVSFLWLCFSVHRYGMDEIGWKPESFLEGIPRTIFPFLLGVCLYHASRTSRLSSSRAFFWLSIFVLTGALVLPFRKLFGENLYDVGCVAILFPALIFVSSGVKTSRTENWISERLGDLSYPLYATHYPMLFLFAGIANKLGIASGLAPWLVSSGIIILINFGFVTYWDVPARYFLKKRLTFSLTSK